MSVKEQCVKRKIRSRCDSGACARLGNVDDSYRLPRGPGLRSLYKDMCSSEAQIRFYYIDSVKWVKKGRSPGLCQTGCGLNLMSKYATLCTCKLKMLRVIHKGHEQLDERPVYVAALGDTKGRKDPRTTPVVFLGKVEKSFDCFLAVWKYLPQSVRRAKDVRRHRLGDLYPPILVRVFEKFGRISKDRFVQNFSHAKDSYKNDLRESKPVVFKEWQTYPEADVGFTTKDSRSIALPRKAKSFKTMIAVPRPSVYGWKYKLRELRSLLERFPA